jgi:hypothetical protein
MSKLPTVHILFENPDWIPPLTKALSKAGFSDVRLVQLSSGLIDSLKEPPEGIWINRISPSSHTRGNTHTVQLARDFLYWLALHNRFVVNGLNAFELEMSKFRQDLVLQKYGIKTPKTILGVGVEHLRTAAEQFDGPFITKHNQGGKGLGIQLFQSTDEFLQFLDSGLLEASPDGKFILQQYIEPLGQQITRVEIVGDRFLFAMHSSTKGGFELCPSDVCQLKEIQQKSPDVCPIDGSSDLFQPADIDANDSLVQRYIKLMKGEGIDVAGIEFVEDKNGIRYTYDINGTTNYSEVLGNKIGIHGMEKLVLYIKEHILPLHLQLQLRVG